MLPVSRYYPVGEMGGVLERCVLGGEDDAAQHRQIRVPERGAVLFRIFGFGGLIDLFIHDRG